MSNLLPLVHQARRTIRNRQEGNPFATDEVIADLVDALAAFVQRKAEIDRMLARLQALSDDHFGYSPDEITWSHAEGLAHYAELLRRITDQAFHEGEHAE